MKKQVSFNSATFIYNYLSSHSEVFCEKAVLNDFRKKLHETSSEKSFLWTKKKNMW